MAHNISSLDILDLDFDTIRDGLKDYLKSQPDFLDYDFEGSAMALLLDVLAYNTYQNAFYTSMVGSEMFLDSAQLRDSVVSRSKMLSYTTRSARGSTTTITATITPDDNPTSITVPRGTQFTSLIDGQTYTWTTLEATNIPRVAGVGYQGTLTVTEGIVTTFRWTVDTTVNQKFIIPNPGVDTTTLRVIVQDSESDSDTTTFNLASDITQVTGTDPVYFLQEVDDEKYEILFGDGIIGKKLINGNIIKIDYNIVAGAETNGVNTFTNPGSLGGYTTFTTTVNSQTSGGADIESIDSIKYGAPKNYQTQNRAVLAEDYKRLILNQYGNIQSINVWGGETNVPAVYGKVFISARPTSGTSLSTTEKNSIRNYLKEHNVLSIEPEFIDPTYLYIIPSITVTVNSSRTTKSLDELESDIIAAIAAFESEELGTFQTQTVYHSRFIEDLIDVDNAVVSATCEFDLQKRFTPNFNNAAKYTVNFSNRLKEVNSDGTYTIGSTEFSYEGRTCYFDDDGNGNLRIYYNTSGQKVYITETAGTINYNTGVITITSFLPVSAPNDEIRINAVGFNDDVSTSKYQILVFGDYSITLADTVTQLARPATTVNTEGSVTLVRESAIGTVV